MKAQGELILTGNLVSTKTMSFVWTERKVNQQVRGFKFELGLSCQAVTVVFSCLSVKSSSFCRLELSLIHI